ncbi:MAG: alpha/beta hydrolase [Pseudomonadota bacterium]
MPLAPEYQAMLAQLAEADGPAMRDMSPAQAREAYRLMRPLNPALTGVTVRDDSCESPGGHRIPLRIYRPEGPGPFGVLVYLHGGGWVIGDLDCADAACRDLAATAGCVIVSVDYRLAPEHPYPAAPEDCYAATCWAASQQASLDGNGKLAVGGESAGGNLAAVVSQRARAEQGPTIDFQLLLYPVVDADLTRASYQENGEGYLLDTETMRWFWEHYCPDPAQRLEPTASPLRAAELGGLPPALILTAQFDPLRDEGAAYAEALAAAGTAAEYQCMDGLIHDFLAVAAVFESARPGLTRAAEGLRAHLSVAST